MHLRLGKKTSITKNSVLLAPTLMPADIWSGQVIASGPRSEWIGDMSSRRARQHIYEIERTHGARYIRRYKRKGDGNTFELLCTKALVVLTEEAVMFVNARDGTLMHEADTTKFGRAYFVRK